MSTVYLVPDDPKYPPIGFDCTIREGHALTSRATQQPLESGSVVSDHIIHEPDTFVCSVMTTQQPTRVTFFGDGVTRPVSLGDGSSVLGFTIDRPADLIQEMLDRLDALRLAAATMTILTSHRTYEVMRLLSIELPKEPNERGAGKFNLNFSKLLIVQTSIVQAPKPKEPRGATLAKKGDTNPQPAPSKPNEVFEADKSLLLKYAPWLAPGG